jgi:hypothetical protein
VAKISIALAAVGLMLVARPVEAQPRPVGRPDLTGADPHWMKDFGSKCAAYVTRPERGLTIRWFGKCVNGVAQGEGTIAWYRDNQYAGKHDGAFVGGVRQGRGVYRLANGDSLHGVWVNGVPHGDGEWRYPDGSSFRAHFYAGRPKGEVRYARADGAVYTGAAVGRGIMTQRDGAKLSAGMAYVFGEQPDILLAD